MNSIQEYVGKTLEYYDGFNGDNYTEEIINVNTVENSLHIMTRSRKTGLPHYFYFNPALTAELLTTGKAHRHYTVDHCPCTETYTIN